MDVRSRARPRLLAHPSHRSIGGGGSGPAEIAFAAGVRAVGLRAQILLGTFTVSRLNGQLQNDSASFLGVRATGGDVITRLTVSGVVTQSGVADENDFFFGPIAYAPEPSLFLLTCLAGLGLAARRACGRQVIAPPAPVSVRACRGGRAT